MSKSEAKIEARRMIDNGSVRQALEKGLSSMPEASDIEIAEAVMEIIHKRLSVEARTRRLRDKMQAVWAYLGCLQDSGYIKDEKESIEVADLRNFLEGRYDLL